MLRLRSLLSFWLVLAALLLGSTSARAQNTGFQVGRYEPTPAGEWSFLVDHPWYSSVRYFAGGLTLDYAHNPFVLGRRSSDGSFSQLDAILSSQLYGHFDFAGSFLDRVNVALSIPVLFVERGQASGGVVPVDGGSIGDPRLSAMVQLYGHPDRDPFSINLGAAVWIPLRRFTDSLPQQESDQTARFLPKLVGAGFWRFIQWSFTFGFLYRGDAVLGQSQPIGSEIQFGFLGHYADLVRRFAVGPELLLSTIVTNGNAFSRDFTSLELLLGGHYNVLGQVQLGAALGLGMLRTPGTPDVRLLLRIAYAPMRVKKAGGNGDRDGDGTPDSDDACPNDRGLPSPDPKQNGCPFPGDLDSDGIGDAQDVCPRVPRGEYPDPERPGCPAGDRDGDGIADTADRCPDTPVGDQPDPARIGCPYGDQDGDGVADAQDVCPTTPKGEHPDPSRAGCPLADRDGDGVIDSDDQCPTVPAGPQPDRSRLGCPLGGAAVAPVSSGSGTAGVEALGRLLVVMKPIFFKHRQATIETKSIPVLEAVAAVLKGEPAIAKLLIRGHTDSEGNEAYNQSLSQQRADAVQKWLVDHGVAGSRLEIKAYGPSLPYRNNRDARGRAQNRRVDFRITDPQVSEADSIAAEDKANPPTADEDDEDGEDDTKRGQRSRKAKKRKRTLDDMLDDVEKGRNVQ